MLVKIKSNLRTRKIVHCRSFTNVMGVLRNCITSSWNYVIGIVRNYALCVIQSGVFAQISIHVFKTVS